MTTMKVHTKCPRCKKQEDIEVPKLGYQQWVSGALIQRAMPGLSATQREQLMTGICGQCWDEMFKEEENE